VRIGLDFDNTIIGYDRAFHVLAVGRGLISGSIAPTKLAVRDHLRSVGREDDWTELQGYVYGPGIVEAEPFAGVLEFLLRCRRAGLECVIVSHKTRHPYRGPAYDLRGAAMGWLEARGFIGPDTGLGHEAVFFEDAKEAKVARIAALGCDAFVDDLPEFLALPGFPRNMARILFDPNRAHLERAELQREYGGRRMSRAASFEEVWSLVAEPPGRTKGDEA